MKHSCPAKWSARCVLFPLIFHVLNPVMTILSDNLFMTPCIELTRSLNGLTIDIVGLDGSVTSQ